VLSSWFGLGGLVLVVVELLVVVEVVVVAVVVVGERVVGGGAVVTTERSGDVPATVGTSSVGETASSRGHAAHATTMPRSTAAAPTPVNRARVMPRLRCPSTTSHAYPPARFVGPRAGRLLACHARVMHPAERVRFAIETAKAVLEDRLAPDEAAAAVVLQAKQVAPLLRSDRDSVTRSESESVATQLRMLAEQITDRSSGLSETGDYTTMAKALGEMAQALR
jgi:hypothetical protein